MQFRTNPAFDLVNRTFHPDRSTSIFSHSCKFLSSIINHFGTLVLFRVPAGPGFPHFLVYFFLCLLSRPGHRPLLEIKILRYSLNADSSAPERASANP
jgi:hypothetical protein